MWKGRELAIPADDFRWEHISNYVARNADILTGPGAAHLGGWNEGGMVYLDSSIVLPADQFDRVVKLCKIHDQIGFFDLGSQQYFDTETEFKKMMDRAAIPYYKRGIIGPMTDTKKKPTVHLVLDRPPDPDEDPEAFEKWAKAFVDKLRASAGLEPLYTDDAEPA
jgi:hypothetical protein